MRKLFIAAISIYLFSCSTDSTSDSLSSDVGQGGSLAQFTVVGDYLYIVDKQNLNVFNIVNKELPVQANRTWIGFDIETLFHFDGDLYVGSQTGMFIYSLENPEDPKKLAAVSHFRACDPVVAKENYAFVTLDASLGCGGNISALQIYDTTDITQPILLTSRNLLAPKGLGLFNNFLFVCDDEIKIFDISIPAETKLVHAINISAFDVIIKENYLVAIGENGLSQYQLNENEIQNTVLFSTLNF